MTVASDWRTVEVTDQVEMYVDVDSIIIENQKSKAWVKLVYKDPVTIKNASEQKTFLSEVSLTSFYCAERAYFNLQTTKYRDRDSTVIVQEHKFTDFRSDYFNVIPDSIGEGLYNFVCKAVQPNVSRSSASSAISATRSHASESIDLNSTGGTFSIWHWIIVAATIANAVTIIHVAVSDKSASCRKAAWVGSCLLVPFIPYLFWLFTRRSEAA